MAPAEHQAALLYRVLFRQRRIGDVSGNDNQVRTWRKVIQRVDGPQKRRSGVNTTVGQCTGSGDVQVGDLGD
jgi:hypothetical protein